MKALLLLFIVSFIPFLHGQSSKELLRDGLFAEESDGDLKTATEKYEALLKAFEAERKVAATALFRLAAVKRKMGDEKATLALYEEYAKKFGDIEPQASMVRENYLAISGKEFPAGVGGISEDDMELARIRKLEVTSPDLFPNLDEFKELVSQDKSRIVSYLLEKGADPNHQGALVTATEKGNLVMVRKLLEAGADPNHENNLQAFERAIRASHWQIAELLGKYKANINPAWPDILSSEEIMNLPQNRIVFLVNHGANPNHLGRRSASNKDPIGIPILDAVRTNKYEYAKLLLKSGAKVDLARSYDGVRALHLACKAADEKMIRILIEAGADLDAPTGPLPGRTDSYSYVGRYGKIDIPPGKTPLDLMAIEDTKILIEAGATLLETILFRAVESRKIELVDYFLAKGADVNQKVEGLNSRIDVPLNTAFKNGDDEMVRHLLSKGAKLSEANRMSLPKEYRILVAREFQYPKLVESGGVHIAFPEANRVEAATFSVALDSDLISSLLEMKFLSTISDGNETRRINYDALTWNLVRSGKVEVMNFEKGSLPQFSSGDILEVIGFADFTGNISTVNAHVPLKDIPSKFSYQLRKAARFPIKFTHAGVTHDMTICPDKLTYDARTNELPTSDLGKSLDLIFVNSGSKGSASTPIEVSVERFNFPKFTFNSEEDTLFGFDLKPGDHITVTAMGQQTVRWEEIFRKQAVSVRLPGKLAAWRWAVHRNPQDGSLLGPSLLGILADLNSGFASGESSAESEAFRQLVAENYQTILPGIDLGRIVIHRMTKEGEEQISIDLADKIVRWVESEKKIAPFDFELQAGDIVDMSTKEIDWKGFSEETNQYFEAALNFPLVMVASNSTAPIDLNFKMPSWHQLDCGMVPFFRENSISSIQGSHFLPTRISLRRGGKNFTFEDNNAYWPKSGDIVERVYIPRQTTRPRPPIPGSTSTARLPGSPSRPSNTSNLEEWPPVEKGEKGR